MDRPGSPIVCSLRPDEILARRASLLPGLAVRAAERRLTAEGYRLRFEPTPGIVQTIAETIDAERQCCRFLRFDLQVASDGGAIDLVVSGPDGTAAFLSALLES